ncbi:phosphonate metabolism transcriptional regulator PhnF [Rhizobium viscosum]|uniref:GntR family phosphonate transport system transcriptional regulator n=1 Tax=Rhizobium viscosum TaxID=1673 RepID=A0ABR9IU91_RHIVS|nr:phosphonate metabolism transcriptional regulator PhnF [Rhizobium viscosum]MBE1506377.1 GntR family phosphonate transport system transcriptional regulator [Rhizobium viscosum]
MTVVGNMRESKLAGVALWRRIADEIRLDIVGARLARGQRLPTEAKLAERFSANRHTVRRALAMLAQEGVIRAEQGRGVFVQDARRVFYRIGPRTRFSEGIDGQDRQVRGALMSHAQEHASSEVAKGLDIKPGAPLIRLETMAFVDEAPFSRSTHWFARERFDGIAEAYAARLSITAALQGFGVETYTRHSTRITIRHAEAEEIIQLGLSPGAVLLRAEGIDIDAEGKPIQFLVTRFPGDRVELLV